jgi:hypothetical protein
MQIMRHAALLTVALLASLHCGMACAQWKWRDAAGHINASDLPPPSSVPERDVLERPTDPRQRAALERAARAASAAASAPSQSARPGTDPELEARRKRAADDQAAKLKQQQDREAAGRAENCSRMRSNLAALSSGIRMSRPNAKGEAEFLDEKAREEETQRARNVIASDCR